MIYKDVEINITFEEFITMNNGVLPIKEFEILKKAVIDSLNTKDVIRVILKIT